MTNIVDTPPIRDDAAPALAFLSSLELIGREAPYRTLTYDEVGRLRNQAKALQCALENVLTDASHLRDDLKMSQQHCQEQGREISRLKERLASVTMQLVTLRKKAPR